MRKNPGKSGLVFLFTLFFANALYAQNFFKGVLVNKDDSTYITNATVEIKETGQNIISDEYGSFILPVAPQFTGITLNISAIGCKKSVHYDVPFKDVERIYLEVTPGALKEVSVTARRPFVRPEMSAEEVVRKAVASIRDNYAREDYFAYSSYRQYQQVNNVFENLVEAKPVVSMKLSAGKHEIYATESFAVPYLRKSTPIPSPSRNTHESIDIHYLVQENPVYHLDESSLQPSKFSSYEFSFDSTVGGDNYLVYYHCKTSSVEKHGIVNYNSKAFYGESYEIGKLTIDKKSFAFRKIQRVALRNKDFSYANTPNYVSGAGFFMELVKGEMIAEYVPLNGVWYTKRLGHQFTNEFFRKGAAKRSYTITDVFEWSVDSITAELDQSLRREFYFKVPQKKYVLDEQYWTTAEFPFYFYKKDAVYYDLGAKGPVDIQFYMESLKQEE